MSDRILVYNQATGEMFEATEEVIKESTKTLIESLFDGEHGITLDDWLDLFPKPEFRTAAPNAAIPSKKTIEELSKPLFGIDIELQTQTFNGETVLCYEFKPITE